VTEAVAILTELQRRGVIVAVEGDTLRLKPRCALDDTLLARVREAKPAILEALDCARRSVGAVLVKNGGIIASACNGVAPKFRNCLVAGCPRCKLGGEVGTGYDSCICLHAEQLALAKAAFHGRIVRGATLYVNLRPCLSCLNLALAAGVRRIVYGEHWSYDPELELQYKRLSRRFSTFIHTPKGS